MDEKDIAILTAVSKLRTGSPEEISDETSIPKSTVHYRLEKLRNEGIIENDLFDLDLTKVGLNITVISEVSAEYKQGYHDEVGEKLAEIEGVNQIYFTMGDTDFVVIAHLADRGMVEGLIESYERIDEIERTSSKFVIKTIKDEPHPLNDFELETLTGTLLTEDD